ncbi:lactonase family protein [Brachybacterium kimchii]|uniref:Lactonase family protein n=1 Tax=Brachybacterium kimchii TaxID=2942909 RepID=A0ABY4N8K3_9MICO|nr:beta-propeller fold lactonase family protein [Brachybacterium kimchii]UQN30444.1 lactonase family protein [Brachybacterium kimchii]
MSAGPKDVGAEHASTVLAYVGSYADESDRGGITPLLVGDGGASLAPQKPVTAPDQAGYLAYRPSTATMYAVDERKTDGRGPVQPPAAVHAFTVGEGGRLTQLSTAPALGPFPTYLVVVEGRDLLVSISHGSFEHIERVVRDPDGTWHTEYVYDDSTVVCYALDDDGGIGAVSDVQVLEGHGVDPNPSPQAGGHGQASAHAHCAVVDPSGRYLLVTDKSTDRIYVFEIDRQLRQVSVYQAPPVTGPRHLVFHPRQSRLFATYEFSSQLVSLDFDPSTGTLTAIDAISTVAGDPGRLNEPADIHIHPRGDVVYVNNRGEDSLAWFDVSSDGYLTRRGQVQLGESIHPGLAARSFAVDPEGAFLLVADRPSGLVRSYSIGTDGALSPLAEVTVPNPAAVIIPSPTDNGQYEGAAS